MISFAQNYEDVILWRCLKSVLIGFYVDVGAYHPEDDSVTKWFYDQGWSGINIEPSPSAFALISASRPRDRNLCVAIGDATADKVKFFEFPGTGLSTLKRNVAERTEGLREAEAVEQQVPVRTLASILNEVEPSEIHFLKIDVEGAESDVLRGMDFQRYRPWIVLVESVSPQELRPTQTEWESVLLTHDYEFVYFDGLNRYYVSAEKAEQLIPNFSLPPNCFDSFVQKIALPDYATDEMRAERQHEATLGQLRERLKTIEARANEQLEALSEISETVQLLVQKDQSHERWQLGVMAILESLQTSVAAITSAPASAESPSSYVDADAISKAQEVASLRQQLTAMEHSLSWRLTGPLRQVVNRVPFLARYVSKQRLARVLPLTPSSPTVMAGQDDLPIPLQLAPKHARAAYELIEAQDRKVTTAKGA